MSDSLIVQNWGTTHQCDLSEDAIRHLFQPAGNYRISHREYSAGESFPGAARSGICYVLSGECELKFKDDEMRLAAGQFLEFPTGDYQLTVIGDQSVSLMYVWLLPEEFRSV